MATFQNRTRKDGSFVCKATIRRAGVPTLTFSVEGPSARAALDMAKKEARKREAEIDSGRYQRGQESREHTVKDLIDRYIEEILPRKPGSAYGQERQLRWWRDQLGHLTLDQVTPARLSECKGKLERQIVRGGTKRSPASVNRYLAVISHVFTIAVKEWHWTEDQPALKVSRMKEPRGRVRFLSDDERTRLLEACKRRRSRHLYPIVVLAIYTGMRSDEIRSLRWSQVDLESGTIILEKTKNDQPRRIPLAAPVRDMLREWGRLRRLDTDRVFPARNNPQRGADIGTGWDKSVEEAGITNIVFHDLRHTAASYLIMSGATLAEVAEILGHKTLAMVKRYAHFAETHTRAVVERMAKKFS